MDRSSSWTNVITVSADTTVSLGMFLSPQIYCLALCIPGGLKLWSWASWVRTSHASIPLAGNLGRSHHHSRFSVCCVKMGDNQSTHPRGLTFTASLAGFGITRAWFQGHFQRGLSEEERPALEESGIIPGLRAQTE